MPTHIHYNPTTKRFAFWSTIVDAYTVYDMTESEALDEMVFKWGNDRRDNYQRSLDKAFDNSGCQWGKANCTVYPTPDVCPSFDWAKAADLDTDRETGIDGQKKDWGPHGWGCLCQ